MPSIRLLVTPNPVALSPSAEYFNSLLDAANGAVIFPNQNASLTGIAGFPRGGRRIFGTFLVSAGGGLVDDPVPNFGIGASMVFIPAFSGWAIKAVMTARANRSEYVRRSSMRFSQFAGIAIVPTMSRLVLALVFITAGFNKIFVNATFDEVQATRLRDMDAAVRKKAEPVVHQHTGGVNVRLASMQSAEQPARGSDAVAAPPPVTPPSVTPPPAISLDSLPPGEYEALRLYHIALLCDDHGMRWPFWLAWIAAVTEFVGGVLILIGLMTRFWGMGLAIAMITAIALTTWEPYISTGPFAVARGVGADGSYDGMLLFNTVGAQLALFVLAFGLFLTGPGPLSLDHMIVRRQPKPTDALGYGVDDDDDDLPPPPPRRPRRDPRDPGDPRDPRDDTPRGTPPHDALDPDAEEIPVSPPPTIKLPKPEPVRSHERPI